MGFFDWVRGKAGRPTVRNDNFAATYGNGSGAGFSGASVNRLTASLASWSGALNADLDGSIVVLRARARALAQSNEYGRRFLSQVATNIVGRTGPKLQVRAYKDQRNPDKEASLDKSANDAIEIHWQRWGRKADIAGRMDLPQLLRVVAKAVARDGECLIRVVRQKSLAYGIALQVLEADRLDETLNMITPTGAIRQGVEIDGTGRALAYYVKTRHPGERYGAGSNDVERIPASEIYHVFLQERAEQVRGYTWFHAILMRASQLHGYNESAVIAARIGASKVAALERTEDGQDLTSGMADVQVNGGPMQMNVEAGEMFELPPGYKLSSWDPAYPHENYESFVKTALRGISAGLDVATHNLSGDMTDVNYSSARIAELAERDMWTVLQDWLINSFLEPVYQEWLAIALLRGDITFDVSGKSLPADKFAKFSNASRFQGRRWRWVDPAKEVKAYAEGVALGITSRTRIAAEQGDDFDDVLDELAQEKTALDAKGLVSHGPSPSAPVTDPDPSVN